MTQARRPGRALAFGPTGPLTAVGPADLSIRRIRAGRGFVYRDAADKPVRKASVLARIRALAVPPAYAEVRISADPDAHLQAVGRDEAGRLQYRYHPDWEAVREARKAKRLARIAEALPRVRAVVKRDLAMEAGGRRQALALAVALIDRAFIRVGGDAYARADGGRGAATLLKRDVRIVGTGVRLSFRGKGGKAITCDLADAAIAKALSSLATLPGRRILQYRSEDGAIRKVGSAEINSYLRDAAGTAISAKDLRMLAGSALAAEILIKAEPAPEERARRRQLAAVMRAVSEQLGNTPAVARKSYVHAILIDAFTAGTLKRLYRDTAPRRNIRRVEQMLRRLAGRARNRRSRREATAAQPPEVSIGHHGS